jgi:hypothetical protein
VNDEFLILFFCKKITVAEVLSHRAGLSYVDQELTVDDVFDWSRITSLLAAEKPHWPPGSAHGYHAHTVGFLAGELVHRADPQHRPYGQFVRDELDGGFYVGVSDDKVEARVAPLIQKPVNRKNDTFSLHSGHLRIVGTFSRSRSHKTLLKGTLLRSLERISR